MDLKALYDTNKDFKRYVDRCCKKFSEGQSISREEALEHVIVKEYANMCVEKEDEKLNEGRIYD